jgi:hypothetical protein
MRSPARRERQSRSLPGIRGLVAIFLSVANSSRQNELGAKLSTLLPKFGDACREAPTPPTTPNLLDWRYASTCRSALNTVETYQA